MSKRDYRRLDEIEADLLDDSKPLAGALRKCLALGGELRSVPLREWASLELKGYRGEEDLPDYRQIPAPILMDGATFRAHITGQRVSPSQLPDVAHEHITEQAPLYGGVGELEDLVRRSDDGVVKLSLPGAGDLARLMNHEIASAGDSDRVTNLYWAVSVSAIEGALDRIRSMAVEIMSEMRAGMPDSEHPPTPDVANQAVNVVLRGGRRNNVIVTTAQGEGATSTATPPPDKSESRWTKTATIWTIIAALVGIAALYVAYLQLVK